MTRSEKSKVLELFGHSTRLDNDWQQIVREQWCLFANTKCFKVRKSAPSQSIGTCAVRYGRDARDIVICPNRMLERRQVFTDCLHLLTQHDPGNELHIVPEISIPGGSVDFFLASVRRGKVKDFVAVEFQTLDTTGTVWPERQRLLTELGLPAPKKDVRSNKTFGMNWKMTAKTILVQLHHKVVTLENIGKHLVLVIQDCLLDYLQRQFNFAHLNNARVGDSLHMHAYKLESNNGEFRLELDARHSTDAAGVARCLGLQADAKLDLEVIVAELESKISPMTRMGLDVPIAHPIEVPTE